MQGNKTNWDPFKFKTTTSSFKKTSPLHVGIIGRATDFFGLTEYGKMEEETKKQKRKLKEEVKQFRELDDSNLYADFQNLAAGQQNVYSGMENVFEDATIDQRAAEFASQQAAQQQANVLSSIQAGGGFTAGNIQALANAAQTGAQQAAASIGQQERQNQMQRMQAQQQLNLLERQGQEKQQAAILQGAQAQQAAQFAGAEKARDLQYQKQQAILGLRAGQLQSAQAAEQAYDPIGDFIGQVGEIAGAAGSVAALASDIRLKKNIKLVGKSPSNINIYNFEYIDSKYGEGVYQGVMANEVPFASVLNEDGYYMVDYDVIDVDFKKL
jgi:hypothetical protein